MTGQIFTGPGRIVAPERDALALREAINDLELQVAFVEGLDTHQATIITRAMMAAVGVDHPVLVMPASLSEQWLADPSLPAHLRNVYEGVLPTTQDGGRMAPFEIVKPGDHHE